MDVFYGILSILAGIMMIFGLFWLIRSGNTDSVKVLMFIIVGALTAAIFLIYIGAALALIGYGTFMILGR